MIISILGVSLVLYYWYLSWFWGKVGDFAWVMEEDAVFCVVTVKWQLVLESLRNFPHSHVRLLMLLVGWNVSRTVCYNIYWWLLYVLGFSQHGIWVPKRQPGWGFTSCYDLTSTGVINTLLLYSTGCDRHKVEDLESSQWWQDVKVPM